MAPGEQEKNAGAGFIDVDSSDRDRRNGDDKKASNEVGTEQPRMRTADET